MKRQFVANSLKGHLLLGMPRLTDDVFNHTVVFVCSHDNDGAVGLIVNRPLESVTFLELLAQFNIKPTPQFPDRPIFFGGPVDVNRGFILHPTHLKVGGSQLINAEIALTASIHFFQELLTEDNADSIIVALGYSGWGPGQLEQELREGQWMHVPCTPHILFHVDPMEKWDSAFASLGIDPAYVSGRTGTA